MTSALGIRVPSGLLEQWREYFAPSIQPFNTERLDEDTRRIGRTMKPTMSHRDTFELYSGAWIWLEEAEFQALPLKTRRQLLYEREGLGKINQIPAKWRSRVEPLLTDTRLVWWPSILRMVGDGPLLSYVDEGLPPSRHREVRAATWTRARRLLPEARELAGTFPSASGPNCFGTVMAAAGVPGAASVWMQTDPFDAWPAEHTERIRGTQCDGQPGIVLVWRNHEGTVQHAGVTIGDGFVINKPSQGWFSPRIVWTVPETIAASRYPGVTLTRHRMTA